MPDIPLNEILAGQAEGLDAATARAKAYSEAIAAATARVEALEDTLRSGTFPAWTAQLQRQQQITEQLALEARNRQQAIAMESGAAARHLGIVTRLNREYELSQLKLRNQASAADLASGAFFKHAQAIAAVKRESEALNRRAHVQQLIAEHGRVGGVARAIAPSMMMVGRGAGLLGLAAGVGMARSGLGGTAEGVRLEYQWTRLARQLAAVGIPAFELLANTVGRVAGWFERLSGRQQDLFLKMGLVVVGAGLLAGALKGVVMVGSALAFTLRTLGVAAGLSAAGSTAAAGTTAAAAGVAGTAGLAGVAGGLGGGAGAAGAGAAGAGAAGAAAAGAAGAGAAGAAAATRASRLGRVARFAGRAVLPAAAVAEAGAELFSDRGFYEMERRRGTSRLGSGLATVGHMGLNLATFGYHGRRLRERGEDLGPSLVGSLFGGSETPRPRRDVTTFGNTEGELGSAATKIQEKLLEASVARAEEDRERREGARMMGDAAAKFLEAAETIARSAGIPVIRGEAEAGSFFGDYAEYLRRLTSR